MNEYYKSDEAFVFAIADAMHEEYKAIVDAGFLLQIDDPDLPDGWNCLPDITLPEYRKYASMRVEALNHALRGIPREKVRLHVCWGSLHGPHHDDVPLKDIVDLIFRVNAGSYSIEASNPCHEHEWRVFEDVKLPEGATLIPGVVGHCTDFIEHPDLVAERLVRYAGWSGARTCWPAPIAGFGTRVGHPSICWAKFEAMAEGARRAARRLWAKGARAAKSAKSARGAKPARSAREREIRAVCPAAPRGAAPRVGEEAGKALARQEAARERRISHSSSVIPAEPRSGESRDPAILGKGLGPGSAVLFAAHLARDDSHL